MFILSFKKDLVNVVIVRVCVSVSMGFVEVSTVPVKSAEGIRSYPGARVRGGCELSDTSSGN